ncbi:SusC/RagA family TonB-linked outer membrane protein [Rapidithrix thailandica]|uniref:SusC/RagA family TonB-linked outer membrane protein n=1 Tax=Rapidithrix thailandica TaxID=413964 RepID=A0AAW9S8N0_9BACT
MNKFLLVYLFLCTFAAGAWAQERSIRGKVTSSEDGEPLPGVSIVIKGTSKGTVTNVNGEYVLGVPGSEAILLFSYVGFKSREVQVGNQSQVDIKMDFDKTELKEVVITALGTQKEKDAIGFAQESIKGEDVVKASAPNVLDVLSGKMAGVNVGSANGVEGGTTRITIRGNNYFNGSNQPLIIVDGVPIDNDGGMSSIGSGKDWGSGINNINAWDIEDLTVLKGPTAAALYGSRGSNGVILITTKKGKKQPGVGITYNVNHRAISTYRYRDVQNVFGEGGASLNPNPQLPENDEGQKILPTVSFYGSGSSWGPKMDGTPVLWWDGNVYPFEAQPDNIKEFFNEGHTTTHNISFSGGGDKGSVRVSLTRMDHQSVVPNSDAQQTTINLGSSLKVSDRIRTDVSVSYMDYDRHNSPMMGDNENSIGKNVSYNWGRSYRVDIEKNNYKTADGFKNFDAVPSGGGRGRTGDFWWRIYEHNDNHNRKRLLGSITLTGELTDWLEATARVGIDNSNTDNVHKESPWTDTGLQNLYYSRNLGKTSIQNHEAFITAKKNDLLPNLTASMTLGGTYYKEHRYGFGARNKGGGNVAIPFTYTFRNYKGDPNTNQVPDESFYDKEVQSVWGYVDLSYKGWLNLQVTGRNDWSSALPLDNNSYFYPSASATFIPTEAFDIGLPWLNKALLRAAFSATAHDTNPYNVYLTYSPGNWNGQPTSSLPNTVPPKSLEPQRVNSYEFGTNLNLFDNRVNIDFAYYYILAQQQIVDSPLPKSSGANYLRINTGEIENRGWELLVNVVPVRTQNFSWDLTFNMNRNRNFVKALSGDATSIELGNIWGVWGPAVVVKEGEQFGTIVGWDHLYHEETGQPIINDSGTWYELTDQRVTVGNASPDWTGGLTNTLTFKNFTLNAHFDVKMGGDTYFGSYVTGVTFGQSPETLTERLGGGLPLEYEGETYNVGVIKPGVYADGTANDKVVNSVYKYLDYGGWGPNLTHPGIYENSWVSFRELSLYYNFSPELLSKTKFIQGLTVGVFGRNLGYLYDTAPDNINPQGTNSSGNAAGAFEWGAMPAQRSYGFNVKVSF